ncbi:hypothetical protein LSH36_1057g00079 [Paralvinella palmiformis]|uniref:Uncharacterized protein n=1 Tax=Paralvinella palmiformis TaxID=53620 RepID=A0AAD9IVJ5_9ANNE|nr:hypothetical protein LSH36_1057g00079 [Paralvinella palmiformis]
MEDRSDKVQCTVCKTTPIAPRLFPCGHVVCVKCLARIISNRYEEDGNPKPTKHNQCPTCLKSFQMPADGLERLPSENQRTVKSANSVEAKGSTAEETQIKSNFVEKSIAFTESSKNMIPTDEQQKKESFVENSKSFIPSDESEETDSSTESSANVVVGDDSRKMDELPVIDAVMNPTEVFTATLSMALNHDDKTGHLYDDFVDVRLPLQNPLMSTLSDKPFDDEFDVHTSEGGSSYDDDVHSNTSNDVNNLCSICKLGQKYISATSYCISCGCLVCAACTKIHQEHSPDREHVLARLSNNNLRTVLCRAHDQLIRFFCVTCCTPVCKACLMEQHSQHKMTDFTATEREDDTARGFGRHVKSILKELLAQKRGLTKGYEVTELNRRETNMLIIRSIDSHIRYLQEKRQELVDNSDRYHGLVKEQMNVVERQVDRATAIMQDIQLKVDTSMYPLPPHSHVVPAVFPITVIQKRFSGVSFPAKDHRDFGITDCKYTLGTIPDAGKLNMGIPVSESELAEVQQIRQNRTFRIKVVWNKAVQARDAHFLPNSKDLLFTDIGKGYTIHKLNCDGKLAPLMVGLSGFAGRCCTFGLNRYNGYKVIGYKPEAKGNDMVLTVFDGDADGTDVNFVGATFPPGYDTLVSLTVTLDGLIVAILSDDVERPTKTSICCFSQQGHLLWQRNTSPSSRAGDLSDPCFVAVDKLDRLIVSDSDGSKVNIYTCDGSHLLSFPGLEVGAARVTPTGICLDSRGRILVSFHDLKVVSLFTPNGNFIRHVVQTIGPPLGISLCDEDRYLVVAIEDHGLWLYNLLDFD